MHEMQDSRPAGATPPPGTWSGYDIGRRIYARSAALIGVPVVVIARAAWQVAPIVLAVPNIKVEHRRRCWRWITELSGIVFVPVSAAIALPMNALVPVAVAAMPNTTAVAAAITCLRVFQLPMFE